MVTRMVESPPSWSLWRAGARMVGHWPENDWGEEDEYISGRLRQEETEQQDWSPLGKTKAGAKSALPPIIFSGLIRWEADLGPCGFCGTTKCSRITRTEYFDFNIIKAGPIELWTFSKSASKLYQTRTISKSLHCSGRHLVFQNAVQLPNK